MYSIFFLYNLLGPPKYCPKANFQVWAIFSSQVFNHLFWNSLTIKNICFFVSFETAKLIQYIVFLSMSAKSMGDVDLLFWKASPLLDFCLGTYLQTGVTLRQIGIFPIKINT